VSSPQVDSSGQAPPNLPAGSFSVWLSGMQAAIDGRGESDVPCGDCVACCTSSQFIHIGPDETDPLSVIPEELLFPAPMMPAGHVLMGYDESGSCPMLIEGQCSIYEHRPQTCRTYDCRVFPAAAVGLNDDDNLVSLRARRWRFEHPAPRDELEHHAVRAAARHISEHGDARDENRIPTNSTQLAVLAIRRHGDFLNGPA